MQQLRCRILAQTVLQILKVLKVLLLRFGLKELCSLNLQLRHHVKGQRVFVEA